MNKLEAAYIAGFIDGEGCLTLGKSPARRNGRSPEYSIIIAIANTKIEILKWIKKTAHLGGCMGINKKKPANHAISYQLHLRTKDSLNLLAEIYPYLRLKKQQAEILFEFYKLRKLNPKRWNPIKSMGSLPSSPEYIKNQERYYKKIRELNKRGR